MYKNSTTFVKIIPSIFDVGPCCTTINIALEDSDFQQDLVAGGLYSLINPSQSTGGVYNWPVYKKDNNPYVYLAHLDKPNDDMTPWIITDSKYSPIGENGEFREALGPDVECPSFVSIALGGRTVSVTCVNPAGWFYITLFLARAVLVM